MSPHPDKRIPYQGYFTRSDLKMALYNGDIPIQMKNNRVIKALTVFSLLICLVIPWNSTGAADGVILPSFADFVASVADGQQGVVRGVYVPEVLALRVVQQPAGDPGFVLQTDGIVTQFSAAAQHHVTGLLAHNNLAGALFSNLRIGQEIRIVYGDGRVGLFMVNRLSRFQADRPNSGIENYLDLDSNITYSTQDIFTKFYTGDAHVTFQTCIQMDGNSSWGRLFVTANPILPAYPFLEASRIQLASELNLIRIFLGQQLGK